MSAYLAYQSLRSFIDTELERRKWESEQHQKTHALPSDRLAHKITEAEEAATSLEWLRQAASVTALDQPPSHTQERMF